MNNHLPGPGVPAQEGPDNPVLRSPVPAVPDGPLPRNTATTPMEIPLPCGVRLAVHTRFPDEHGHRPVPRTPKIAAILRFSGSLITDDMKIAYDDGYECHMANRYAQCFRPRLQSK